MIELELNDIAEITSSKRIFYSDYVEEGIPFYRSREIINLDNGEDLKELIFITQEKYLDIKNKFGAPEKDDILITSVGTIGNTYIVRENDEFYFKDGNLTWLRNWKGKTEPKFVFYWLKSPIGQGKLYQQLIGSSQKALTIAALKKIKIEFPEDKTTQRKIASILSAYDDLIENNLKRIKLLEEKLIIEYTLLEEESRNQKELDFSNFVTFVKGIEPGSSNYLSEKSEGTVPFIRIGDLNKRDSEIFIEEEKSKGIICNPDDVLVSMDGTIGIVKYGIYGCYSSGIRKAVSNGVLNNAFVFCYLSSSKIQGVIYSHSKGSTIQHAGSSINHFKIKLPKEFSLENFIRLSNPIYDLMKNLLMQNIKLREARDILLPKLMNGQIGV